MSKPVLYSWLVSPYSAKTRSTLRYKAIDFEDRRPSALQLKRLIEPAVGKMVMPTVVLPDGRWLQDSGDIVDHFEADQPEPTVHPPAGPLAVASALLELFADEWLPMAALHYRWSIPANARFARAEFAANGLPWLPGPIGRRLIKPMATRMSAYLPILGVTPATIPGVERTVALTIAAVEQTLAHRPFLLGGRPCLGDFALYGPLWAHLFRDPGSTHLFDAAPAVVDWMERLTAGARAEGPFEDAVPDSLDPVFRAIVEDQLGWVRTLVAAIDAYVAAHPDASRVPRALGTAPFSIQGCAGERKLVSFMQYKTQRARDAHEAAPAESAAWLARFSDTPETAIPPIANPFDRVGFKEVLRR